MPPARPIEERFWEKVDKRGPDDCWNWTASTCLGYGQIGYQGRIRRAHQIAWELQVGPRTPELVIDHLCFNRLCQNVAHMEEVTQGENARRGRAVRTPQALKEFCPRGHPYTRLSTGHRQCNECNRQNAKQAMQRLRGRRRAEQIEDGTYRTPGGQRRTHCKHGHEFTPENTHMYGATQRCRSCNREYQRMLRARRKLSN